MSPSHVFTDPGTYQVSLTVSDSAGGSESDILTITVADMLPPPEAIIEVDVSAGPAPLTVRFSGTDSVEHVGEGLSYTWDFGDGNVATGELAIHTYQSPGVYQAFLSVEDGPGQTDSDSDSVTITVTVPIPAIPSTGIVAIALLLAVSTVYGMRRVRRETH